MALVIDVQDLARMDAIDAHNYVERLAETLTSIRDSQIPITWVTMRKNAQLYKPLKTDPETSSQTRDTDQLREMGFHGIDPEYDNHEIFKNFLLKHGPRTDEVVSCKSTKSALVEEIDAKQKPEYQNTLEAECGETLSTYFGSQEQTLADYMREQGINNTIIMGAVSSHCIAETAASSSVKGFNPNIITDRLLSWQGDEDKVDPKTSLLLWHGYSGNDNDWNSYHQSKLDNKLAEIMADISRDFSRQNLEDIGNIRFATSSILSEPLFSEKTEFGIQAAKFVRT
jgi:nicotinamidase-related amidase